MTAIRTIIAAAALLGVAACASGPTGRASEPLAGNLARPELPRAGPGKPLDLDAAPTRLAFGSCNRQDRSQAHWPAIAAMSPDLFVMLGDNVYGDIGYRGDAGLDSFREAYAQQAGHPAFTRFRADVPMMTTWDDHDYGPNDSGGDFAFQATSERMFEAFWDAPAHVRKRAGVYDAVIAGPPGRRVQVIVLDTRYFRSPLKALPLGDPEARRGRYIPDDSASAQMLGDAQWRWLEAELARPADLRIVVSSIQVLTEAHRFERWSAFPGERQRLLTMLAARNGGGMVLVSGDRHSGGIYREQQRAGAAPLIELTTSSLNAPSSSPDNSASEPDPRRVGRFFGVENFGLVDIDWAGRAATLRLMAPGGGELERLSFGF